MKKNTLFLTLMAVIVCAAAVGMLALPHESFSEEENRALAAPPKLSLENILGGKFFERLSSFCSDAMPARKTLVRMGAVCELALGKGQSRDVVFMSDGRLVDRLEYESIDVLEKNLAKMAAYAEKDQNFVAAIVPRSADIYLEGESVERVGQAVCEYMGEWELRDALKGQDGYYKTDHHLNADGAYTLYEYVVRSLGETPYEKCDFDYRTFSTDFLGSTYSKSGLLAVSYDTVLLPRYEGDTEYTVYCEDEGCELDSLYCLEASGIKDKYRVFTDGNHGMLHVRANGAESRQTLLIYKDSFANAILPMLARHFDLVVCDPRYTDAKTPESDLIVTIMGVDLLNSRQ